MVGSPKTKHTSALNKILLSEFKRQKKIHLQLYKWASFNSKALEWKEKTRRMLHYPTTIRKKMMLKLKNREERGREETF